MRTEGVNENRRLSFVGWVQPTIFSRFGGLHLPYGRAARPPGAMLAAVGPILLASLLVIVGCGGEPSRREVDNARAFEALLTAVSLRNAKEFERDSRLIEGRHEAGEISDGNYREIAEVIARGRANDWAGAEKRAYAFRAQFGDRGSFFR